MIICTANIELSQDSECRHTNVNDNFSIMKRKGTIIT